MNIFLVFIILSLVENFPEIQVDSRANRRYAQKKAIARKRSVYNARFGKGKWYDIPYHDEPHDKFKHPELEGKYVSYHKAQIHSKPQANRWATESIGGHRRFAKWEKEYYGSPEVALDKYFQKIDKRWEDRYGE